MRILIHDRPGHPFEVQLSRELARRGHDVLHSYGAFFQSPRGALSPLAGDPSTLQIVGLQLGEPFAKYTFGKRILQEVKYSRILQQHIVDFAPDVVMFANTPSEAMCLIYWRLRHANIRFVFWVQDFYSVAVQKILRKRLPIIGRFVGQMYIWMDKYLLKHSDHIVLITEDFKPLLQKWGVDLGKTTIIPNWATLADLPVCQKRNEWAVAHGLADTFCFLYAGTLGMKHNPALLLALAQQYVDEDGVQIVVVSQGMGADWLREQQAVLSVDNLLLLEYQPFDLLPQVLGTADVLLAILEPDAGVFSVPSKVLSYLCGQRPLLLAVPHENLAARLVLKNDAGLVVEPDAVDHFLAEADLLYKDGDLRERLGRNGRFYAETHFHIIQIADEFEHILRQVVA